MTNPERLRSEIEETRAGLGDTVEALAAKTDVKTRIARNPSVRRYGPAAAAAVLLAAVTVVVIRRRR